MVHSFLSDTLDPGIQRLRTLARAGARFLQLRYAAVGVLSKMCAYTLCINNRLTRFPVPSSFFLAPMSTPKNLETTHTIPIDLTGKVKYETADKIDSGHAHIYKGIWTTSEGTATTVRFLLPSHCGGSMITHTTLGCGEGRHGGA